MKIKGILIIFLLLTTLSRTFAQGLDLRLEESINGPINLGPDRFWRGVSNGAVVVEVGAPLTMAILGLANNNKALELKAIENGGAFIIAEGGTVILKHIFKRARPYLAHPGLVVGKSNETDYSFPSGHASAAFATATSLSIEFPKWYVVVPSYAFAGAVSYSRLYLGVHYPSDVLGGAILSSASAWFTWKAQKLLDGRNRRPKIR